MTLPLYTKIKINKNEINKPLWLYREFVLPNVTVHSSSDSVQFNSALRHYSQW